MNAQNRKPIYDAIILEDFLGSIKVLWQKVELMIQGYQSRDMNLESVCVSHRWIPTLSSFFFFSHSFLFV